MRKQILPLLTLWLVAQALAAEEAVTVRKIENGHAFEITAVAISDSKKLVA